jgi:asparagine synthase (glutamine-hydrolysing)
MCGIVASFGYQKEESQQRDQLLEMAKKIRHRGPDWSGIYSDTFSVLAHERLAIVDPASGKQPLFNESKSLVLAANGEIYNHRELRSAFKEYKFMTQSDCEVLLPLYQRHGASFLDQLNGIFAFALYDREKKDFLIARDHMGIIPLYMGWDEQGVFYVASELKALEGYCNRIELFPPGHYMTSDTAQPIRWYDRDWKSYDAVKENETSIDALKEALEAAVKRQLMSDVPYGVLLSGGLDSSITSAVAKKYAEKRIESDNTESAWWPQLHSFAVGLEGSPDLAAARKVADYIKTVHHEVIFTIQEGLDAIKDVIYHLETYDITTVRAATPMYLMARVIKSMGIKMVLSGEGSDELFGGYLYFHKAPNAQEFHEETVRKLDKLHMYDCLRANKSLAAWGIEGRVPFLDKEFIDVAMRLNPNDKMINGERMEKWVLRKAFEDMLPAEVAWRQKEQFSDGVGYSWIDTLKEKVNEEVSDAQMEQAAFKYPIQTPQTKEEYFYRSIFASHFPSDAAALSVPQEPSVACSTKTALEWDAAFKTMNEPSGRAIKSVHTDAYEK